MTIRHHIGEDLLLGYAAGTLAEGWSLAVATHLAMCIDCRRQLELIEATAGVLVETLEPVAGGDDAWTRLRTRIASEPPVEQDTAPARPRRAVLPEPLRSYLGADLPELHWRNLGVAKQILIPIDDGETQVRLLRIPAGKPVPEHSHGGRELTLVLTGSFHDEIDTFRPGDVEDADGDIEHQPIAGADQDCVCLAVTDAPLKFRSRLLRLVQPMLGI